MSYSRIAAIVVVLFVSAILVLLLLGNPWRTPVQMHTRLQGIDPFLHVSLFQLVENSLLKNPLAYYDLPFLYPDPVPIRGTEPLISLALFNIPIRILSFGSAPLSYALQVPLSMILLAVLTFAALRVLGVGRVISAMAGISTVALHWWYIFSDRLQMFTLFWLPLVVLLLVLWLKSRRIPWLVTFTVALTLLSLSSLYVTLAFCFVGLILSPLFAVHLWRLRRNRSLLPGLFACGVSAVLTFLLLIPWLSHRWDTGIYFTDDFLARKTQIDPWALDWLAHIPPELMAAVLKMPTSVEVNGSFPGFAVLLFSGAVFWQIVRRKGGTEKDPGPPSWLRHLRMLCGWSWLLWAIVGSFMFPQESTPLLLFGDLLLWGWLGSWIALLALRQFDWGNTEERNPWLSAFALVTGVILILLTLGSPMRLFEGAAPVSSGLYTIATTILPPFDQARGLLRFIIPAGWFFVMALGLSAAGRRLEEKPAKVMASLMAAFCILAIIEVWGAEPDSRQVPEIFPEYSLLKQSEGHGGLLELPYYKWPHVHSIRRMYWQPQHGRKIADGCTGFMPAWRAPARFIYNRFPSAQCLALLRKWNIDSVLAEPAHDVDDSSLPAGVLLRGTMNGWRLYDLDFEQLPGLEHTWIPEDSREVMPTIYRENLIDQTRTNLLTDEDTGFKSKVTLARKQWMLFHSEGPIEGIVLDFGYGAFFRIPGEVVVEARVGDQWRRVDIPRGSRFIGARCADLLMNSQFARIYIPLRETNATVFRLRGKRDRWDLPELRLIARDADSTD